MKHSKWFEKDGNIYSEKVTFKQSKDFRKGKQFACQHVVAYNVGSLARHIAELHNSWLESKGVSNDTDKMQILYATF